MVVRGTQLAHMMQETVGSEDDQQQLQQPPSAEDEAAARWARLRGLTTAPASSSEEASSDEGASDPDALADEPEEQVSSWQATDGRLTTSHSSSAAERLQQ